MWPLSDRTRRRWANRLFFLLGIGPLVVIALSCLWLQFGPMATVLAQRWSWKLGANISIAEAIVRAHGGDISVQSAPGEGSVFTVTLPKAMPAEK